MTEHLSNETIALYQRKRLNPQSRFQADIHLATCPPCRGKIGEDARLQALYTAMQEEFRYVREDASEHLTNRQIISSLEKGLDAEEQEIVGSHLAWCASCGDAVKEMQEIISQVNSEKKETNSFWMRLRDRLRTFWENQSAYVLVGSAFAALMLVMTFPVITRKLGFLGGGGKQESVASVAQRVPPASAGEPSPGKTPSSASVPAAISPAPSPSTYDDLSWLLPEDQGLFKKARDRGELETPPIVSETGDRTMGGREDSFKLLGPGSIVTRDRQPTLKWQPLEGTSAYTVLVLDLDREKEQVVKTTVTDTELMLEGVLTPGHQYRWQVSADKSGKLAYGLWKNQPYADFTAIAAGELQRVAKAEKQYRDSSDPLARIALAARYAKAGLVEDAERELKTLLRNNAQASLAARLLANLKRKTDQ